MKLFKTQPPPRRYELLTRSECHLCEVMKEGLKAEISSLQLPLGGEDVDEDSDLLRRSGDSVPALLRNGVAKAKGRLEPGQLKRILFRRR